MLRVNNELHRAKTVSSIKQAHPTFFYSVDRTHFFNYPPLLNSTC